MDDQKTKDINEEKKEQEAVSEQTQADNVAAEAVDEQEVKASAKGKNIGFDDFRVGDTIRVFYKIIEGDKLRTQPYEGIVISKRGEGVSRSFTVRRIGADGVGIERIFPASTPNIDSIKLIKQGKVRRAKLYYLREKVGRAAMRIKEIKK